MYGGPIRKSSPNQLIHYADLKGKSAKFVVLPNITILELYSEEKNC